MLQTILEGGQTMKITRLDKVKKVKMIMEGAKDIYKQIPISKNDGAPVFSLRVFTNEPSRCKQRGI